MTLLILYLLLALLVSFLCSMLESVILSVTPPFVEAQIERGRRAASALKHMKANIDRPLAGILSLNTIAHTVGAAGVGAQAAHVFGRAYVGVASAALTFLILVLSEIIPKTIGARYWRVLALPSTRLLQVLVVLLYPLVLLSQGISRTLRGRQQEPAISRDEVSAVADIGHRAGVLQEAESKIVKNLVRFRSIRVEDVMTPRTVVTAASEDQTVGEAFQDKRLQAFSRVPLYSGTIDQFTGYVHRHDLLQSAANDQHERKLKEISRDLMVMTEEERIPGAFEKMMREREQIALVIDEFGGMAGIVTFEDLVETLLGVEIVDEFDSIEDMRAYAREAWKRRARGLEQIDGGSEEQGREEAPPPRREDGPEDDATEQQ